VGRRAARKHGKYFKIVSPRSLGEQLFAGSALIALVARAVQTAAFKHIETKSRSAMMRRVATNI
jgi:hypothetical protein